MRLITPFILILGAAAAQADPYANPRFGFALDIPPLFRLAETSFNGDGATFVDDATGVELLVYGANDIAPGLTADREFVMSLRADAGDDVTYAPQGDDWYVLSGFRATGDIFYIYTRFGQTCGGVDMTASYQVDYPPAQKDRFEPLLAELNDSLRLGQCN